MAVKSVSFILQAGNLGSEKPGVRAEVTHSITCSGSPHSPPQGRLHSEAWSDILPPLSFSYSGSTIPFLPQKTTTVLFLPLSLTPPFLTTWKQLVFVILITKGWLTPSITIPTKSESKYSSKEGSKNYLKSYFLEISPNILVLLWLFQFIHTHMYTHTVLFYLTGYIPYI